MNDSDLFDSDPRSLTQMMDLEPGGPQLWNPEELGAILEHQLSAPLECDLDRFEKRLGSRLGAASDPPIKSFRDLLHHPHPPVELLELTKRFAKACRNHPDSPLPDEIATVVYLLSIVAAITRCGRRITKMDDQSLNYSLNWALKQPWLNDSTRELLQAGRNTLRPPGVD